MRGRHFFILSVLGAVAGGSIACVSDDGATTTEDAGADGAVTTDASNVVDAAIDVANEASVDAGADAPRCNPTSAFGAPVAITVGGDGIEARLSSDELTLFFSAVRASGPGSYDIYTTTRATLADTFAGVNLLAGVNTANSERMPSITADGLFLYAATSATGAGPFDISLATRTSTALPFGALALVGGDINGQNDVTPYILPNNSALYFASDRGGAGSRHIYRAAGTAGVFGPSAAVLGVASTGFDSQPVVTPDELTMFFASDRPPKTGSDFDMYEAHRTSIVNGFNPPVALTALNSAGSELPSWVSPDGCFLYYNTDTPPVGGIAGVDLYYVKRGP